MLLEDDFGAETINVCEANSESTLDAHKEYIGDLKTKKKNNAWFRPFAIIGYALSIYFIASTFLQYNPEMADSVLNTFSLPASITAWTNSELLALLTLSVMIGAILFLMIQSFIWLPYNFWFSV